MTRELMRHLVHYLECPLLEVYIKLLGSRTNYADLSANSNLNIKFIIKVGVEKEWDWSLLSSNPNVASDKALRLYPFLPWDWGNLSALVSFEFYMANIDKRWSLIKLVKNERIPLEYLVRKYRSMITLMFDRSDFTLEWAQHYKSSFGSMRGLHLSANEQLVEENMELPWNYVMLSANSNISPGFRAKHADKPWIRNVQLMYNPFDMVSESWSLDQVLQTYLLSELNWMENKWLAQKLAPILEREFAAMRIQNWWLKHYYTPRARICRNRLTREAESMAASFCTL